MESRCDGCGRSPGLRRGIRFEVAVLVEDVIAGSTACGRSAAARCLAPPQLVPEAPRRAAVAVPNTSGTGPDRPRGAGIRLRCAAASRVPKGGPPADTPEWPFGRQDQLDPAGHGFGIGPLDPAAIPSGSRGGVELKQRDSHVRVPIGTPRRRARVSGERGEESESKRSRHYARRRLRLCEPEASRSAHGAAIAEVTLDRPPSDATQCVAPARKLAAPEPPAASPGG